MIQRVVLIRLATQLRNSVDRAQVAEHTRQVLGTVPSVLSLNVGTPADPQAARDWDVSIVLTFTDLDAVEEYRVGEIHRKYVDLYLKPLMHSIRVLNFEIP